MLAVRPAASSGAGTYTWCGLGAPPAGPARLCRACRGRPTDPRRRHGASVGVGSTVTNPYIPSLTKCPRTPQITR